jgi:SHS family lactate transporter-like MFS transporter
VSAIVTPVKDVPLWREPTRAQWICFLAAWFGWVLDAFDFTVFLLVMPRIAKDFHVTITATAWTVTLTLLLRLVGGVVAGAAADRWGRKLPLMISVIWFAACDGAIAFAPSFTWVLVLRTLFGLGMGAEWASGATLAMESWPERSRGIASGVLQGSWAIGYLLAAQVARVVLDGDGSWRTLFLIAAAPAILVLPIRLWVPETLPSAPAAPVDAATGRAESSLMWRRIGWGSFYMALAFSAYYGITSIYPTLLAKELHASSGEASTLVSIFNIGMLVGAIGCGYLASRWTSWGTILLCALITLPVLPLYVGWVPGQLRVGAFLGGMFGGGYAGVTPLLLTSMFPAKVRARAVGFVYHIGACFAAFAPTIIAALTEHEGLTFAQSIVAVTGAFQVLLAIALVLRPRGIFDAAPAPVPSSLAPAASPA